MALSKNLSQIYNLFVTAALVSYSIQINLFNSKNTIFCLHFCNFAQNHLLNYDTVNDRLRQSYSRI